MYSKPRESKEIQAMSPGEAQLQAPPSENGNLQRQLPEMQLNEGSKFAFEYSDMAMLHYSRNQRIEQLEGLSR